MFKPTYKWFIILSGGEPNCNYISDYNRTNRDISKYSN